MGGPRSLDAVSRLTASAAGGVAVLRVSGPVACDRLRVLVGLETLPAAGHLKLVQPHHAGEDLDEALLCGLGAAEFELHLHGSPALVAEVLALLDTDPHPARSLEERARYASAHAPSELGARVTLAQADGRLRRAFEDLTSLSGAALAQRCAQLVERYDAARFFLEPTRVVLAGPTNAGKSTLFNALIGSERVIVSARAGTTRDAIRERVQLGGLPVDLVDTAGERVLPAGAGQEEIEAAGQRAGRAWAESAHLVLWLQPVDAEELPAPPSALRLWTCADRPGRDGRTPAVTARTDPNAARATLEQIVRARLGVPPEAGLRDVAVPFEVEQRAALARWASAEEVSRAELNDLLEAPLMPRD